MPRKAKKYTGVEELPLDDAPKAAPAKAAPKAAAARTSGSAAVSTAGTNREQVSQLQMQARQIAADSTARTTNMLQKTTEAKEVGVEANRQLQEQTRQLENINQDIEEVHDILDRGEKTVNKMTGGWFAGLGRKGRKGKGKGKKKDDGVVELDVEGEETSTVTADASEEKGDRSDLLDLDKQEQVKEVKKRNNARPKRTGPNAAFHEELDQAEEAQDDQLDQISSLVKDLKGIAVVQGEELEKQSEMIDTVREGTTKANARLRDNNQKLKRLL